MNALLYTQNLLDSSRVTGTAQLLGIGMSVVPEEGQLVHLAATSQVGLVLVDLTTPGLDLESLMRELQRLELPPKTLLAFGPHVQKERLAQARQAGCDQVYPRSEFFKRLADILGQYK
jgi:CheY-like chemotaxis protein